MICSSCGRDTAEPRVGGLWCRYEHRTVQPADAHQPASPAALKKRLYYVANRTAILARQRDHYLANRERCRERSREYMRRYRGRLRGGGE